MLTKILCSVLCVIGCSVSIGVQAQPLALDLQSKDEMPLMYTAIADSALFAIERCQKAVPAETAKYAGVSAVVKARYQHEMQSFHLDAAAINTLRADPTYLKIVTDAHQYVDGQTLSKTLCDRMLAH